MHILFIYSSAAVMILLIGELYFIVQPSILGLSRRDIQYMKSSMPLVN